MTQIYDIIEPLVLHIRPGTDEVLKQKIVDSLTDEQGYMHLNIEELVQGEAERGTGIGKQLNQLISKDQCLPTDLITKMLNKIIYSGKQDLHKVLLNNYPATVEQASIFEKDVAKMSALIYPTTSDGATVELKNKDLSIFSIDSLMSKQFRLKTMTDWSWNLF